MITSVSNSFSLQQKQTTRQISGYSVSPEKMLVGAILFFGTYWFCLPVANTDDIRALYPWWAKRIGIGNILLAELLVMVWLLIYGWRSVLSALQRKGTATRQAAMVLLCLALWCGLVSLFAPLAFLDFGRTLRLLLFVALLPAIVIWARRYDNFPLLIMVLGFFAGTIINLIISYRYPLIVNDTMRLSGQNTPGPAMAIAIHLAAWLFVRSQLGAVQLFSLVSSVVMAFGCAISFSRTGWFGGLLGLMAWVYILFIMRPRFSWPQEPFRRARRLAIVFLLIGLGGFFSTTKGRETMGWVQALIEQKFRGDEKGEDTSAIGRKAYVYETLEILQDNPLGVGYSGFYDAVQRTETYQSGDGTEEFDASANPHSYFLYHFTAGGVLGGFLAIIYVLLLLRCLSRGLTLAIGRPGMVLSFLAAPAFLVFGASVPYLANTIILIAPAGIAAGWGWSRQLEQSSSAYNMRD